MLRHGQARKCCNGPGAIALRGGLRKSRHVEVARIKTSFHARQFTVVSASLDGTILRMTTRPPLILGSTSRYRREMLGRLRLPFEVKPPDVDETPLTGELPAALAMRLALAKAHAVAKANPQAIVIGSDQVADLSGKPIGKPGTHEKAVQQLREMRGRAVVFQTAVAVVHLEANFERSALVPVTVRFRDLTDDEIEHYLRAEQPYDCAGSAKSEGLGIALLSAIESDDPTALVGLPLIQTCAMLREAGLNALDAPAP
jgi:septum formation protein